MLTWLTAWARLIVDDDVASQVANQAVARAASRRKRLRGADLKVAARHEAAGLLARGIAAAPKENGPASPGAYAAHAVASATFSAAAASQAYAPRAAGDATAGDPNSGNPTPRDPREQTTIGRLEMALETLAPYERLACVSYFLDGVSTDAIAALLGVPRDRAIRILEQAAPTVARAVGDNEIPDFSVATDEVEVVAR